MSTRWRRLYSRAQRSSRTNEEHMSSYNKVILMGNLTRKPEVRYLQNGNALCKFGLAVNRRFKDAAGEWKEEATFVDITFFGKRGGLRALPRRASRPHRGHAPRHPRTRTAAASARALRRRGHGVVGAARTRRGRADGTLAPAAANPSGKQPTPASPAGRHAVLIRGRGGSPSSSSPRCASARGVRKCAWRACPRGSRSRS
jgi:hypothetical protein